MQPKIFLRCALLLILLAGALSPATYVQASRPPVDPARPFAQVSAFDLILAMNTLRVSNGLPALIEDPIVMAVAQATAETMAANQMSWHIGDVRGRLASAGYGGGATVWATENFAVGKDKSIDEIMLVWGDASHMIPAVNPAYCHVGAGVATAHGQTYYILQAAYSSASMCGEYKSVVEDGEQSGGSPGGGNAGNVPVVPQIIVPVKVAAPDAEGKIFHEVQPGQSFWAIAVAYKVTIKDIETWNNISRDSKLQVGQLLFIPSASTEGYATPTPAGWVRVSEPDRDGRIVHEVEAYNTLSTISDAYGINVDRLLGLNGWQIDWPLQIGQKLLIDPGNVTPSPTLSPIQKLKPDSDGRYYHTIQSGETLSWIAQLYEISVTELMGWNSLTDASIIYAGQKLLLPVTPPATGTPTPLPPTATLTATPVPRSPTPEERSAANLITPTVESGTGPAGGRNILVWVFSATLALGSLLLVAGLFTHRGSGSRRDPEAQKPDRDQAAQKTTD